MGWLRPVTLSCISLLSLLLPGALSQSAGEHQLLVRLRKSPDRRYFHDLRLQAVPNKELVTLRGQGESHPEPLVELHPLPSHRPRQRRIKLRAHRNKGRGKGRGQGRRRARGRGRRHTRRHHTQLMRMGCAFSTCQLQNLSHRLRNFLGNPGKKEMAPVNLTSPHSYG